MKVFCCFFFRYAFEPKTKRAKLSLPNLAVFGNKNNVIAIHPQSEWSPVYVRWPLNLGLRPRTEFLLGSTDIRRGRAFSAAIGIGWEGQGFHIDFGAKAEMYR